jgi:hypothetical protein
MNSYLPDGIHFSDEEHGYQTDKKITAIEVKYYCAQIQLRITLNSIHNALYATAARSEYMPPCVADLVVPLRRTDANHCQNYNFRFKEA